LSPARIAIAAVWSLALPALAPAQDDPPLPEGNAYVRGVLVRARPQDTLINDYSYDVEESRENLDRNGDTTSRETRRYEVYFVKTRPVRRLVAKNGAPLSAAEQAEVDRKARAQAAAITEGRTVSEQPGLRLATLVDSFEFKTVAREVREGRETLVVDFEPRKTGSKASGDRAGDAITRILMGRLYIDEADRRVAKLEAHSTPGQKASVATGVKVGTFELLTEYTAIDGGVWLPRKVMTLATGRAFLFKTFRIRNTTTYSNYRRFSVATEEKPKD
jgi:hypothetical protein